jgi:hypothetical protein
MFDDMFVAGNTPWMVWNHTLNHNQAAHAYRQGEKG